MLRSLFAGVTGLQAHQIAMDIEGNNIANVNTTGFKYSRANFSDLLSQTKLIATAPQGTIGGKNALQVGLGAQVQSATRIFSQGSVEVTDKNTDVAIQGDGFFIVSDDRGTTLKYTRAGDFNFDADGNLTDNGGNILQGWLRDPNTNQVDNTMPITSINIPPGLTTAASATTVVNIKANLSAGTKVDHFSPVKTLDSKSGLDELKAEMSEDFSVLTNASGNALLLKEGQGIWVSFQRAVSEAKNAVKNGKVGPIEAGDIKINGVEIGGISATDENWTAEQNAIAIMTQINLKTPETGVVATTDGKGKLILTNDNDKDVHNIEVTVKGAGGQSGLNNDNDSVTAYQYRYSRTQKQLSAGSDKQFQNTEELRAALQMEAQKISSNAEVVIGKDGRFAVKNGGDEGGDIFISVTGIRDQKTVDNLFFTQAFESMQGNLYKGTRNIKFSQSFNVAEHSASIDVFDSLGTKHTLKVDFRKEASTDTGGTTWSFAVSVPHPGKIVGAKEPNTNRLEGGQISFNNDGSIAGRNPTSISFASSNGSAGDQTIVLNFGKDNTFEGLTSFDAASATSGVSQDGYTGGDLIGIRIDQSGTLVGSFTNGRSFGLAQLATAKFTNKEGLIAQGGNIFSQSANSGDAIIGVAATGGRGFIQSSALEGSNVDLSRALTNLIVIQRGFQANSKTITTSDQLLNTLLQLKQ
ncbi:MAG: flagellar hook protein FlgE [Sulfuricurvum sp. PC08-66]|nr:MAG: flagellar hook protein FlgE [Sulfuricurvum sp. PC08-66]